MQILGIDIGGSGIKGALVETEDGTLLTERFRLATPQPSKPKPVCKTITEIVQHFDWHGTVGCTFPAIVHHGVILSAANIDPAWIDKNAQNLIQGACGGQTLLMNDADAAAMAELRYGAGRGHNGLVIMITLGTGIGSALLYHGELVPNAELGHLQIRGKDAESRASDRTRQEKNLTWKQYAKRLQEYLVYVEFLLSPDLFIIGGGVSKEHDQFLPRVRTRTPIVPAELLNDAGIVGAALAAERVFQKGAPPPE